jgi:hypothetical protein
LKWPKYYDIIDNGFDINIQVFGGEKKLNTYQNARKVLVCAQYIYHSIGSVSKLAK